MIMIYLKIAVQILRIDWEEIRTFFAASSAMARF